MASVGDKRGSDGAFKTVVIGESMMEISEAQLYDYYRQSLSSQGFKVPEYGGLIPGGIGPYRMYNEERKQLVTDLAKRCLKFYNDQNVVSMMRATFEFDKIDTVNSQAVAGYMYYIIFTARSGDNASKTFYGKVWEKIDRTIDVKFCEMATKQEAGTSEA